jgi:hypothetical protein
MRSGRSCRKPERTLEQDDLPIAERHNEAYDEKKRISSFIVQHRLESS